MNRRRKIIFSATFFCSIVLPWQVFGASITEKRAAIGYECEASQDYCTAMGAYTTASGYASTAMGVHTTASAMFSTIIGKGYDKFHRLTNNVKYSFMVGYKMSTGDDIPEFFVKDGAVGIGTKKPQNLLDLGETMGKKLAVFQKPTGEDFYGFGISSATLEIYAGVLSDNTNPAMVVKKSTGRIGIGTKNPDYLLEVDGSAGKPGGGSWADSSDERLKKDIAELDGREALDKISQLRGVTFYWINPGVHSEGLHASVLAQDLEVVFPDWVGEVEPKGEDKCLVPQGEKIKTISFPHDFNAYLIEAIKELKAQNEELRSNIEELRSMIKALKSS
jgi:hypothetical protein